MTGNPSFESSTFKKNPGTEATAISTSRKQSLDDLPPISQQLEDIYSLYRQGKAEEWKGEFKLLLERLSRLHNLNKEKSSLYNQPIFLMLLKENNLSNSRKHFDSTSMTDGTGKSSETPRSISLTVNSKETPCRLQVNSMFFESEINGFGVEPAHLYTSQRNLGQVFAKETLPTSLRVLPTSGAYQKSSKELSIPEALQLVKRPPSCQKVVPYHENGLLSKTSKSKYIPENRIRSKKSSPGDKTEVHRRRGSFDLISETEEFDGSLLSPRPRSV